MSDNEIKPVAWVERNESGHYQMVAHNLESWANRRANPQLLYDQSAIDVLSSQISELKTMLSIAEFQRKEMQAERDEAFAAADSKAGWEWKKRAEKAEAERDAAVADAARYRWLVDSGRFCPSFYNKGWGLRSAAFERSTKESLDAAIDAARAEGWV